MDLAGRRVAVVGLGKSGLAVARFDECGIDARCAHIDDQGRRVRREGIDGVVFVADSQPARLDANVESMSDLEDNLVENGYALEKIPLVLQYNKRDLPGVSDLTELRAALNPRGAPELEAAAASGRGVFETLKAVSRLALLQLKQGRRA